MTASTHGPIAREIANALAPWFLAHRRDLSWRGTTDPYAIWVSEVMLQQTRVETVERYWGAFLRRFPDVGTLAAADEEQVLHAWSGLGYYRRARMLHRGAKVVAERFGAELPRDAAGLREIPGIGPYTAGAITTIAYDQPAPIVDGNVARVLSRILAIEEPREQDATARSHWDVAHAIVREGSPRVLAQALMELGATVCTPRTPRCDACPLASSCAALAKGLVDDIPAVKVRGALPLSRWWALAIEHDGRTLFVRRPDEGLLASLWCLPLVAIPDGREPDDVDDDAIAGAIVGRVKIGKSTGEPVSHTFTHRVWEMHPLLVRADAAVTLRDASTIAWLAPGERPTGGLPTLTR
ncbi:MAG TPA: A/G-specific adenine glycosylase, partial [Nannocystaceae bacterium]|nr:A/G-specific adenine glycosylase [Nannocystaceae bacterium]